MFPNRVSMMNSPSFDVSLRVTIADAISYAFKVIEPSVIGIPKMRLEIGCTRNKCTDTFIKTKSEQ